jgi:hypothetical protein
VAAPRGPTSTRLTISSTDRLAKAWTDLYAPEITNVNGLDNTVSVDCTVANDQLKVMAIINEIKLSTLQADDNSMQASCATTKRWLCNGDRVSAERLGLAAYSAPD